MRKKYILTLLSVFLNPICAQAGYVSSMHVEWSYSGDPNKFVFYSHNNGTNKVIYNAGGSQRQADIFVNQTYDKEICFTVIAIDVNGASSPPSAPVCKGEAVDGVCNSLYTSQQVETLPNLNTLCTQGTLNIIRQESTQIEWECLGKYQGMDSMSCWLEILPPPPVDGVCAFTGETLSEPPDRYCLNGSLDQVSDLGDGWLDWTCLGMNGGGNSGHCSAYINLAPPPLPPPSGTNGACGSSNGGSFSTTPNSGLCLSGFPGTVLLNASSYQWNCFSENGGSPSPQCQAAFVSVLSPPPPPPPPLPPTLIPISGTCGTSNGQTLSSAPLSGLCSTGVPGPVSGSGPWNWTCFGIDGGENKACSANVLSPSLPVTDPPPPPPPPPPPM